MWEGGGTWGEEEDDGPESSNTLWRRGPLGDGDGSRKGVMSQREVTRVDPLRRGKGSSTKRRKISR